MKESFIFCRAVCSLGGFEASLGAGGPSFVIVIRISNCNLFFLKPQAVILIRISVADPDSGSGVFLTPGSGVGFFRIPNPGSQTHISRA
jgi:hypothetical protein